MARTVLVCSAEAMRFTAAGSVTYGRTLFLLLVSQVQVYMGTLSYKFS